MLTDIEMDGNILTVMNNQIIHKKLIFAQIQQRRDFVNFAARINSFYGNSSSSIPEVMKSLSVIPGITHVDLNYPEHLAKSELAAMKQLLAANNLKVNGISPRFRSEFIHGEISNPDSAKSQKIIDICKDCIDCCRELNGEVVTIWFGYDGYDYSFQVDYAKVWNKLVTSMQEICDYAGDLKVSIEYKPFQPRTHVFIPNWGTTMSLINDTGCDNLGVTLDFCHMLMAGENPAYGLCVLAEKNKLYGIHLNDGNKMNDDGLMIGAVNLAQTLEFIYYLKKYAYTGAVYFDTFPVRENPDQECLTNVAIYQKLDALIDTLGMDAIQAVIDKQDGIAAQKLLLDILR